MRDLPREKCQKAEVETFSQYANGEVYGYTVSDDDDEDSDTSDSCFGFFEFYPGTTDGFKRAVSWFCVDSLDS